MKDILKGFVFGVVFMLFFQYAAYQLYIRTMIYKNKLIEKLTEKK